MTAVAPGYRYGMSTWPRLVVDDWKDTHDTLHMWAQIVGKVRLALSPPVNHWWHTALYVAPRGLRTSLVPYGDRSVEITLDLVAHRLRIETDDPDERTVALEPKPLATFYRQTVDALADLGIEVPMLARPVEVPVAEPFAGDRGHDTYDPAAAERFRRLLTRVTPVLERFRGRFLGKASPVHLFWGGLDLAVTRFSGRAAPPHPGGAPNVADRVMVEGYSHELSSAGYFAGGGVEGAFYAYAYPTPTGFAGRPVRPAAARYDHDLDEFLLPYEDVRTAADPEATLDEFLQTTYEAAADLAGWDRDALERPP